MRAGDLRHRIQVERPSKATGKAGDLKDANGSIVATLRAAVAAQAVPEAPVNGQVRAARRYKITVRGRAGILPTDRIHWGSKVLGILGIADPDGRGITLEIDAYETVA